MANFVFVLSVDEVGGELELSLESETPANTQRDRRDATLGNGHPHGRNQKRKDYIKSERDKRRKPNASPEEFIGPHVPIILLERANDTDMVVWKCSRPFVVDMAIDTAYSVPGGVHAPRSPLTNAVTNEDFSLAPQVGAQDADFPGNPLGGNYYTVKGEFRRNTGAIDHIFYKCTVWSNGLVIDPDFYCDAGI
jgi:hypothetical protein